MTVGDSRDKSEKDFEQIRRIADVIKHSLSLQNPEHAVQGFILAFGELMQNCPPELRESILLKIITDIYNLFRAQDMIAAHKTALSLKKDDLVPDTLLFKLKELNNQYLKENASFSDKSISLTCYLLELYKDNQAVLFISALSLCQYFVEHDAPQAYTKESKQMVKKLLKRIKQ